MSDEYSLVILQNISSKNNVNNLNKYKINNEINEKCVKKRRNGIKYDNILLPKKLTQIKKTYVYKLTKSNQIASGGQSSIYRGKINKKVYRNDYEYFDNRNEIAIKFMKNNRDLKNIFLLSTLKHKNIIKLYDYNMSQFGTRIIMEMCVMDLNDFYRKWLYKFRKARNYTDLTKQICKIILDSLEGLCYIHSKYIIHHDIKPENIMLSTQGDWKYIDFDLSIKVNGCSSLKKFYLYNKVKRKIGTIIYYAPEIITKPSHSPMIDVYSLGTTMYTIITGKNPFVHPKYGFDKMWAYHFIREQDINWQDSVWNKLINGSNIKKVIQNMMNVEVYQRPKPNESLQHICKVIKIAASMI